MRVGILGCGNIADNYVAGIRRLPGLELVGCASRTPASAHRLADRWGLTVFSTPEALLAAPEVDTIVNLTPPRAHAAVIGQALDAGKHVFTEKPLTVDPEDGAVLVRRAAAAGLRLGSAPDTFLGGGGQRARQILDEGAIGTPIACTAFVRSTRPELWHPNPDFLFQPGGGPVLDLGPYYLTMLVSLLGPIRGVSAVAGPTGGTRPLSAPDRVVDVVKVEVPTHVSASLTFANGVVGTMVASFDIWETELPFLEIYGDEGTMVLGNPDNYDWPVRIRRRGAPSWQDHAPRQDGALSRRSEDHRLRGIGLLDMAHALHGEPHRANGALGQHVLDALTAFEESNATGNRIELSTQIERPAPWPTE